MPKQNYNIETDERILCGAIPWHSKVDPVAMIGCETRGYRLRHDRTTVSFIKSHAKRTVLDV